MFEHLLITRFNLRNPEWDLTKNKEQLLDNSWMSERMELFKNYCFPSVLNQSNTNFKWLLFFDISTNEIYKTEILELLKNHQHIIPFFINGMPEFHSSILDYIKTNLINIPYLITSRIDNDDCIHVNFINEVQNKFAKQDFMAIDFIEGYTMQIEPNFILGKKEHVFNPFISLIEKNSDPKTVWHYAHTMWKREPRIIQVKDKRIWLSIIHGKNKVNEFDGYGNIKWSSLKNDFKINPTVEQKIEQTQLEFSKWCFLSLKNFLYVKMVLLSKILKKSLGLYRVK